MKTHEIKISEYYLELKQKGKKQWEIRENDRNYKVGDLIKYTVIRNDGKEEKFEGVFEIKFILEKFEGLKEGFVIFSDSRIY